MNDATHAVLIEHESKGGVVRKRDAKDMKCVDGALEGSSQR